MRAKFPRQTIARRADGLQIEPVARDNREAVARDNYEITIRANQGGYRDLVRRYVGGFFVTHIEPALFP
jgi:hypothetical protein